MKKYFKLILFLVIYFSLRIGLSLMPDYFIEMETILVILSVSTIIYLSFVVETKNAKVILWSSAKLLGLSTAICFIYPVIPSLNVVEILVFSACVFPLIIFLYGLYLYIVKEKRYYKSVIAIIVHLVMVFLFVFISEKYYFMVV